MFCGKCGTENVPNAKFCKMCGNPLKPAIQPETDNIQKNLDQKSGAGNAERATSKVDFSTIVDKLKALPKRAAIGACVVVAAIIAIAVFVTNARTTVNLNKYVVVDQMGYNGYGTAHVHVDWDKLKADYGAKITYTEKAKSKFGALAGQISAVEAMQDYIYLTCEPGSGLSNGDEIRYVWNVNEEGLENFVKCRVKYQDASYTISELTEMETYDAFANLNVEYSGVEPYGKVRLEYTGTERLAFDCDQTDGLSNGDVITVTVSQSELDSFAQSYGKLLKETQKTYTVAGLQRYITMVSNLNDDTLEAMREQGVDAFHSYVAKNWDDEVSITNLTYLGNYLLYAKEPYAYSDINYLFLVYRYEASAKYQIDEKSYAQKISGYWYIRYSDIIAGAEGASDLSLTDYATPNNTFYVESDQVDSWGLGKTWYFDGYSSLADLHKNVVQANSDYYRAEENVEEQDIQPAEAVEGAHVPVASTEDVSTSEGYILPDSDKVLLKESDMEGLTAKECRLARNEIYARHGRRFDDPEIQAYFDSCSWYHGTTAPENFDSSVVSDTEIKNLDLIKAYEAKQGYNS